MYLKIRGSITKNVYLKFLTSLLLFNLTPIVNCNNSLIDHPEYNFRKLFDDPKCPVTTLCPYASDDVEALECLQELNIEDMKSLGKECLEFILNRADTVIEDRSVQKYLQKLCSKEVDKLECKVTKSTGNYLSCIIDYKEDISNAECIKKIQSFEIIAFFDLRWLSPFLDICRKDLKKYKCSIQETNKDFLLKGKSLACLQNHVDELEPKCKVKVFKLTEMQSDNIYMNPDLQNACKTDRLKLCRNFSPGSDDVVKCLMQYKDDNPTSDTILSSDCKDQILKYQKLITQDFKVSKGMMKACREDIRNSKCRKQISDDRTIRLTQILLCIENYVRNGSKISPNCEAELVDQRKMLMEDFRLSPEIVSSCKYDIQRFCTKVSGRTIHCLMEHATSKKRGERIEDGCQKALEDLIKETDAGENWKVDPILQEACQSVVDKVCFKVVGGDARVISCLLNNFASHHMTQQCEAALIEIQYFVARDYWLDPQLYRACHEDAVKICHAKKNWASEDNKSVHASLILPCLYRSSYNTNADMKAKPECMTQIRRVMRQRAVSVDLLPEIEEVCLYDLSYYCFERTEKGSEIMCLQTNLNKLRDNCRVAVANFTEEQAQHVYLNPVIMKHCSTFIDRHCKAKKEEDDVMDCLILHKNDPDVKSETKCRAAIEHFQLVSLKNYHFTYKFKLACKPHVMRFCQDSRTKAEVILCLSEIVRNDTLLTNKNHISKDCRQQLRSQLFQQRENINFDVKLKDACKKDIDDYCKSISPGSAQVLECLKSTKYKLSPLCQKQMFKIHTQDMKDNSIDYTLVTMCQDAIKKFCLNKNLSNILECLKNNKDDPSFDNKCRHVVVHRLMEQIRDYRLNQNLQMGCNEDIHKFCSHLLSNQPEVELEGKVIECLEAQFRKSNLQLSCQNEMTKLLREQALNYQLNPLLKAMCHREIETYCVPKGELEDAGQTEECLKNTFLDKKPMNPECKKEMVILIQESEADIHVDPLLQAACSIDLLRYCSDVQEGNGQLFRCLAITMTELKKPLDPKCKKMLSRRIEMFRNADLEMKSLEDLHQLYTQVLSSPANRYFMIVFITAVGLIFFAGTFCGRVTFRAKASKNK